MHNASMSFETVAWQQTILWGSWHASDSRGIMTLCKTKFSNKLGFIKYLHLKLVMLMVKVNLPRLTLVVKQNKL